MADRTNLINLALIVSALTTTILCVVIVFLQVDNLNARKSAAAQREQIKTQNEYIKKQNRYTNCTLLVTPPRTEADVFKSCGPAPM